MSGITLTITEGDGTEHEIDCQKIGGRGDAGDMNWGVSGGEPKDRLEPTVEELRDHLGEPVVLSGGGGRGVDVVILEDAEIQQVDWGPDRGDYKIRATVTLVAGNLSQHGRRGEEFTPWVDSWQISAIPEEKRSAVRSFIESVKRENARSFGGNTAVPA